MKPVNVQLVICVVYGVEHSDKDLKFKVVIMWEHQNIKIFLQRATPFAQEIESIVPWALAFSDINDEEIVGTFYKKELKKTSQKYFAIGKSSQGKR